jgi:ABC-2 type transport system ATP-binding protein/transposase
VFDRIKGNRSFRRFSLRGQEKVHTEFGMWVGAQSPESGWDSPRQMQAYKKAGRKTSQFLDQPFSFRTYWKAAL